MGLYVPDAWKKRVKSALSPVDKLNQACEGDFVNRVENLMGRLQAA